MYSHEIENVMKSNNYNIKNILYSYICQTSPQINHIKYNSYEQCFEMWIKDNYYWKFKVNREDNIL